MFTYTAKYPDEGPVVEIQNENFEKNYVDVLLEYLNEQIKENLGMVMIFTLVSSAQEWLNEKWDEIKKQRDEEVLKKQKEEEEAERVISCLLILFVNLLIFKNIFRNDLKALELP